MFWGFFLVLFWGREHLGALWLFSAGFGTRLWSTGFSTLVGW